MFQLKKKNRKGAGMNSLAKTNLSFAVRDFVCCYVTMLPSIF